MILDESVKAIGVEQKTPADNCALRLGEGREFAEFEPSLWRLTVYHVLGVSRHVSLGYAEVYLLDYFAKHPGEMISRQELLDHAWGGRVVSQGSLNQAISTLRALLGDDQKREIIITVPRRGYQLNADALMSWDEWLERKHELVSPDYVEPAARELPSLSPPPPLPLEQLQKKSVISYFGGAIVLLLAALLVGVGLDYYYLVLKPYSSVEFSALKTQVTLIAATDAELENAHETILPVIKRIDGLGGGRLLVSQFNNTLAFNCFRQDGTLHTLLSDSVRIQSIADTYLRECLK